MSSPPSAGTLAGSHFPALPSFLQKSSRNLHNRGCSICLLGAHVKLSPSLLPPLSLSYLPFQPPSPPAHLGSSVTLYGAQPPKRVFQEVLELSLFLRSLIAFGPFPPTHNMTPHFSSVQTPRFLPNCQP